MKLYYILTIIKEKKLINKRITGKRILYIYTTIKTKNIQNPENRDAENQNEYPEDDKSRIQGQSE